MKRSFRRIDSRAAEAVLGPRRALQAALLSLAIDYGPEVWELGARLAPAVLTIEDAREAAAIVREAFDGPDSFPATAADRWLPPPLGGAMP